MVKIYEVSYNNFTLLVLSTRIIIYNNLDFNHHY